MTMNVYVTLVYDHERLHDHGTSMWHGLAHTSLSHSWELLCDADTIFLKKRGVEISSRL